MWYSGHFQGWPYVDLNLLFKLLQFQMLYKGSSASKSREPWKKGGATQSPLRKE